MNPELGIVWLAVLQVLCVVAILLAGLALAGSGRRGATHAQAALAPAMRIKTRVAGFAGEARRTSLHIVDRGRALAANLGLKWRTTRQLLEEVVRPQRPVATAVTEPLDRGRHFAQRMARLHAAARKAAGPGPG